MGLTFKENCPDIRNSKVGDNIKDLNRFDINPIIVDPWANENDAMNEYGISITRLEDVHDMDCVIMAVAHDEYKKISLKDIKKLYRKSRPDEEKVLIDVKGLYKIPALKKSGLLWWRL